MVTVKNNWGCNKYLKVLKIVENIIKTVTLCNKELLLVSLTLKGLWDLQQRHCECPLNNYSRQVTWAGVKLF